MIREIAIELQKELQALGVPLGVVTGPEDTETTTWGRERIVVEYDTTGSDTFAPSRGIHFNPKMRFLANEACKLTIYAQSTQAGASVFEHRRRAKLVRDKVLWAIAQVAGKRKNGWKPGAGRFITPADLADAKRQGGAVYELKFTFEHGADDRTWSGAKHGEATIGNGAGQVGITSSTIVAPDDGDPTNSDTLNGTTI